MVRAAWQRVPLLGSSLHRWLSRTDTIVAKLSALVLVASVTLALVGLIGYGSVETVRDRVDELYAAQTMMSRQQHADMMHDALHADVLVALTATTPAERAAAVDDTAANAVQAREALAEADRIVETDLRDPELDTLIHEIEPVFLRYAAQAQSLASLATVDPAAARGELAAFDASSTEVEDAMANLTREIQERASATRARADAAATAGRLRTAVAGLFALLALGVLGMATLRSVRVTLADKAAADAEMAALSEDSHRAADRHQFGAELHEAFEMAGNELDAYGVVGRAVERTAPTTPAELLLADSSRAHLRQVVAHPTAGGPGCPVESPWDCVAVRRGQTVVFADGNALNACPKLRQRPGEVPSAVCVPVTFMGRALGVLHATGPAGDPPPAPTVERLTAVATQAGTRVGTLRATEKSEMQAATDPLTGLQNRRSLEAAVRRLQSQGRAYTLVMADLDHFKRLNDTYGHDAGDRALRVFADILRQSVRDGDVVARQGGEEFVLVFPDRALPEIVAVLDRLRARLAEVAEAGAAPRFTASFGIADRTDGANLEEMLAIADERLLAAKRLGRDRIVTDETETVAGEIAAAGIGS